MEAACVALLQTKNESKKHCRVCAVWRSFESHVVKLRFYWKLYKQAVREREKQENKGGKGVREEELVH